MYFVPFKVVLKLKQNSLLTVWLIGRNSYCNTAIIEKNSYHYLERLWYYYKGDQKSINEPKTRSPLLLCFTTASVAEFIHFLPQVIRAFRHKIFIRLFSRHKCLHLFIPIFVPFWYWTLSLELFESQKLQGRNTTFFSWIRSGRRIRLQLILRRI